MNGTSLRALLYGLLAALYLRFGLEPTGWLFYEASHALSVDWLYWGYSVFRGGGHVFGLWAYQGLVCVLVGVTIGSIVLWRSRSKEAV